MFLLAYLPPLWFAVMNPRLLSAVERDPARIKFALGQREALCRQFHLPAAAFNADARSVRSHVNSGSSRPK